MGYVTRSQFHQCLSYLELPASEEEMAIMQLRFSNNKGFNYLQVGSVIVVLTFLYKFINNVCAQV